MRASLLSLFISLSLFRMIIFRIFKIYWNRKSWIRATKWNRTAQNGRPFFSKYKKGIRKREREREMMMISYSGLPNGMNGRQLAPLRAKHEAEERERESSREGEMNNLVLIWLFSDEVFERWCLCCMRYNTAKKGKWKSEKKNQSGLYTHRHTHTRTIFVRKIGKIIKMRKKMSFHLSDIYGLQWNSGTLADFEIIFRSGRGGSSWLRDAWVARWPSR